MSGDDDLEHRVRVLEEQVDILRRALLFSLVAAGPASDWLEKKMAKVGQDDDGDKYEIG